MVLLLLFSCIVAITARNRLSPDVQSALRIMKLASELADREMREMNHAGSDIPYVMVSYAQTIDGSIAPTTRGRIDISSETSFKILHSLRAKNDAVLVGINTLLLDNPQLNVREALPGIQKDRGHLSIPLSHIHQPRSVILDSTLRFFRGSTTSLRVQRPIVFTCVSNSDPRFEQAAQLLREHGGVVVSCRETEDGRCDLLDCMKKLKNDLSIDSVLVEGGARILQDIFERGIARHALITIQPCFLGGYRALTRQLPRPVALEDISVASVGGDIVILGRVSRYSDDDGEGSRMERSLSFTRARNVNLLSK